MLEQIFRQKDDSFVSMLNDMRRGVVSHESLAVINNLVRTSRLRDEKDEEHLTK